MDFSEDLYRLIEVRCSPLVASLALWSTVFLIVGAAVAMLVTAVIWVRASVVSALPGLPLPAPSSWTDIAITLAITLVVGVVAAYLAVRGFQRWERRHLEVLDAYFGERLLPRIARIEQNDEDSNGRITALEAHTDISWLKAEITRRLADGSAQNSVALGDLMGGKHTG